MLKFEHVSKIYKGKKRAVNDLNFDIKKGEFICFIGPKWLRKNNHDEDD